HPNVHECQVGCAGPHRLQRRGRRFGLDDVGVGEPFLHDVGHATANQRVVVNDQDPHCTSPCPPTGSTAEMVVPCPGVDSTCREPPNASARARMILSPKWGSSSKISEMPLPRSSTETVSS